MASAHAAGAAALVWAQLREVLGRRPTPDEVEARLEETARRGGILSNTDALRGRAARRRRGDRALSARL